MCVRVCGFFFFLFSVCLDLGISWNRIGQAFIVHVFWFLFIFILTDRVIVLEL